MTKQTATSRSAPWSCHQKSASDSRSDCMRSHNTPRNSRPRPDASWASSKGWEKVRAHVFLSDHLQETMPGSPTSDFIHSLKEATSRHKQGFSQNIRNDSWREVSKDIFQSVRPVGRDDPRRHYWERNSEKHKGPIRDERSKDLRYRRSAFSRISMAGSPTSYSKTEAHIRDTDRSSEHYESSKIKRIKRCETNLQSETGSCEQKSQESNLQEDQMSAEQDAHWMEECNERGKSRLVTNLVVKEGNPLSKEGSFEESKPGKVHTSLADLMKQNPFHDRKDPFHDRRVQLYRQGDQRKKVWEFACALAHDYLHQKYLEEGERLQWSDPVVGHDFEMPKPWDDLERLEDEQEEPKQIDGRGTKRKTIVSGLHLFLCQPKELCMDEVVNPTQAAAWFGDQLVSGETATLVS